MELLFTSISGRPGHWRVPGGKIRNAKCADEAVVREAWEEIGQSVLPIRRLGDFGDQSYCHYGLKEGMNVRPNPQECSAYAWVSPANILSVGFITDFKRLHDVLSRLNFGTSDEQERQWSLGQQSLKNGHSGKVRSEP